MCNVRYIDFQGKGEALVESEVILIQMFSVLRSRGSSDRVQSDV